MYESNRNKKVTIFRVIGYGLNFYCKLFPVLFFVLCFLAVASGIGFGLKTLLTQTFYDSVEDVLTKKESLNTAFLMISALGFLMISHNVLNSVRNYIGEITYTKSQYEIAKIIHEKMARINPIYLEDTKFHDDIDRASGGAATLFTIASVFMEIFTFYIPYFVFMGLYLHQLKPRFIIAIVFVFIPVLFGQVIRTSIIAKLEDDSAPVRRRLYYPVRAVGDKEYFKETRLLGAFSFFIQRFLSTRKELNRLEISAGRKSNLLEICMGLISAAGYGGILYLLVTALLAGEITVGSFAAVFTSIGVMVSFMEELIQSQIGFIASDMGKAFNFIRFLDIPDREGEDAVPDFEQGIAAENVSFTYPHAEKKSLSNISVKIKSREIVAIVGENGAGKTTLVRLLMGIYIPAPGEGKVTINGMDTAKTNGKSLFSGVSGVFQRFQRYQMTLEENVRMSDSDNTNAIDEALEQANVDINEPSFPDGRETMLSREFDGVDLSGGQWQRVAIARGLYRTHNIIILDEPTAAIDPIEETRIYNKFIEISQNKTAIIVTHRLGSAKIADRIIVMDKGQIVNIGTHDELMKTSDLYAKMFHSQASWYK